MNPESRLNALYILTLFKKARVDLINICILGYVSWGTKKVNCLSKAIKFLSDKDEILTHLSKTKSLSTYLQCLLGFFFILIISFIITYCTSCLYSFSFSILFHLYVHEEERGCERHCMGTACLFFLRWWCAFNTP